MLDVATSQLTTLRWDLSREIAGLAAHGLTSLAMWRPKLPDSGAAAAAAVLGTAGIRASSLQWAGGFTGGDGRSFAESVADAVEAGLADGVIRVPGAAVFMFKDPGSAPPALEANLLHNHALHRITLVVSVLTTEAPRVPPEERLEVSDVVRGVYSVVVRYGYMDTPDVVEALGRLRLDGEAFDASAATYFLGREAVSSLKEGGMARWRERLFAQMNRSAASAARFYQVPGDRVLEVGSQVDI